VLSLLKNRGDSGSHQVAEAGRTMEEIVASVRRVTDILGEISSASQEQTQGIEQINQAITQMDQVTQQNAALVEEAAAAAGSLQEQAGALLQVVATFKVAQPPGSGGTQVARTGPLRRRTTHTAQNCRSRSPARPRRRCLRWSAAVAIGQSSDSVALCSC